MSTWHPSRTHRSSNNVSLVLGYGLEEMYWSHVEFFPSHAGIPTDGVVDDVLNTLVHAQGGTCMRNDLAIVVF